MSPMNRALYPSNWEEISKRIRDRSGGRCECRGECGLHHGRRCCEKNGTDAQYANGTIVLTVAHLDHDPQNSADDNLKAMCQRCHLRYDSDLHVHNAARTRDRKRGQLRLDDIDPAAPSRGSRG